MPHTWSGRWGLLRMWSTEPCGFNWGRAGGRWSMSARYSGISWMFSGWGSWDCLSFGHERIPGAILCYADTAQHTLDHRRAHRILRHASGRDVLSAVGIGSMADTIPFRIA